ncbi:hypothetical protein [Paractinoplanes brasiliensis]|uniref:Uncharacterized protein n=1 Tax=Paractinoplanes brasiliensis TaxID=52695 RepID=A0A4R6JS94_9ACTN|nr:hypothetical protein [Actinoplanes brasiliensis]TDO39543.1 hypothetical protein C8E87_3234 [Actinoplanes brasiliensis]GID29118.1 hypothetical protein Abr02nite_41010 [Actinoplanes brasiliensis]
MAGTTGTDSSPERQPQQRPDGTQVLLLVQGSCAAIAGAFLTTGSIAVTAIIAGVAVGVITLTTKRHIE